MDMEIICYTPEHKFWAYSVGVPGIIIWGLGIPLFGLLILNHEKDRLDSITSR